MRFSRLGVRYGPWMVEPIPVDTTRTSSSGVRLLGAADGEWRRRGPTPRAMRAFGLRERAVRRLPGGAGYVWTDGRVVVKPVGFVPEHDWVCEVFTAWTSDTVRVPQPVLPKGDKASGWSVDGWGAHVFLAGRDVELLRELDEVKDASDAFHHSVKDLARPDFMDDRDDPWAYGDRLAWQEAEPDGDDQTLGLVRLLTDHLAPVTSQEQVIHGDILPNVLVADGLPPAVIDWPPYFRPIGTANAVAVTDAITFRGGPLSLLDEWETGEDWNQLLVRALLYRLGPTGLFAARNRLMGSLVTHVERVRPVVAAVLSR
jgi:uncharacterized protein (TIGR02569 family)